MQRTEKVMQEVEKLTIFCDLCGKSDKMPRYRKNRDCHICGREVCGNCQGPYPDSDIDAPIFDEETICVVCRSIETEYLPEINETYRTREALLKQWKENSLAMTPKPVIEDSHHGK